MTTSFEDEYLAELLKIETAVLAVYKAQPELLDLHVDQGLGALASRYRAEEQGKTVLEPSLKGQSLLVYEAVQAASELLLGRQQSDARERLAPRTVGTEELLACLARIRKSVRFWTKTHGARGYLNFAREHVPLG